MAGCCESKSLKDVNLEELHAQADMVSFNKDVINIIRCLKIIEITMGKEPADDLKNQIIGFIQNEEIPGW